MNKKTIKDELIKALQKKANGFYYTEEVYEYEKTQNNNKNTQKQLSFFENNENSNFCDRVCTPINFPHDTIDVSDEKEKNMYQESPNLTLTKKKITKHYIPPDMLAIKTLFEIYGQKVNGKGVEEMSDDELIKTKNKLIGELANDNIKNIQKS